MPIEIDMPAMAEKENPNRTMKIILRTNQFIKKEINKKIKASSEKNSITFFSLNLVTKKLLTNIPRPKNKRYMLSIRELKVTGTFIFSK